MYVRWLIIFVLLSGCASSDPWTRRDTVLQVAYTAVSAADHYQTTKIQYRPDLVESNPVAAMVLGGNPGTSDVWQVFATMAITNYLISRALPSKWRPYWQGAHIVGHAWAINKNCNNDLGC